MGLTGNPGGGAGDSKDPLGTVIVAAKVARAPAQTRLATHNNDLLFDRMPDSR
jgi:hypothetical protein